MRVGVWRWLTFAAVLTPVVGVGAIAQPPGSDKPGAPTDSSAERAKLQADLLLVLKRISASPAPMPYPPAPPPSSVKPKADPGSGSKSIDPIREGMNLFRDNDFEGARLTFQFIDPTALNKEDRAFVRYMLACSLRRQNKTSEAQVIYREVADAKDDEFLTNCAIWQLSLIKSDQELQSQLEQLRSRAKSK